MKKQTSVQSERDDLFAECKMAGEEITRLNFIIANLNKIRLGIGGTFIVDDNGFPTTELLQKGK